MRNKVSYILIGILLTLNVVCSAGLYAATDANAMASETTPLAVGAKEPSGSFMESNSLSIGADDLATTISTPSLGPYRSSDLKYGNKGWGFENPFLPGGEGWEIGETGNVGAAYPLGDASLPILFSMLLLYFLYRGVSSSKRKNNF